MNIITWSRSFETGIDIIDFQHKLILSRGNDLIKEINNNGEKASIEVILKDLFDYLFEHFRFEEQMFSSIIYKNKDNHLKEHEYYREKLSVITRMFLDNEKDISEEVFIFFDEWITKHIIKTDKDFVKELKKHIKEKR